MLYTNHLWTTLLTWFPGFSLTSQGDGQFGEPTSWLSASIDPWDGGLDDGDHHDELL